MSVPVQQCKNKSLKMQFNQHWHIKKHHIVNIFSKNNNLPPQYYDFMKDIQNWAYDISRLDRLGQLETGESESMHKLASKSHPNKFIVPTFLWCVGNKSYFPHTHK